MPVTNPLCRYYIYMNRILLLLLLFVSFNTCYSQIDSTEQIFNVKRRSEASATFTYNGLPVSPLALYPFLPGMEVGDTIRPMVIKLQGKLDSVDIDTFDGYLITRIEQDGYQESIAYKIVGKTDDNKFVLDVRYNGGGTITFPYIFVFKIVADELVKVALFDAVPAYLQPANITLKGIRF